MTVNGRYRIERELGRGGIGVVYLARDLRLHDMPVVIKFLLEDSTQNPWLSQKFLQEAEALTRIQHPRVVRVIDRDSTPDGRSFFVMEFVKGVPLRAAIRPMGLDLELAASIVRDVGQALAAAHREGVLHRDLKPENVMLETLSGGEQHAKLIDFGIAKVRDSREGPSTELGTLAGSLFYLAPEQLLGAPASAASDVYAFAAVAYELLTGRRPFNPESSHHLAAITQLMTLQRSGDVVPLQQLRPGVSAAAQAIVLRGLAFDPAARPADARQFGDDLASAILAAGDPLASMVTRRDHVTPTSPAAGEALAAPVATPAVSSPATRRRTWIAAAAAAAVLGAVLVGVYLTLSRSSPREPLALQKQATGESRPPAEVRTLTYSMTLRRNPRRYPGDKAITLAREVVFAAGDQVRFEFRSPQGGYLYVFNQSPAQAGGARSVNVLFPSPTSNGGSAELGAGQVAFVPGRGDGFVFDTEAGVERLWIVWSRNAQPDLDALKAYANPDDGGEIKDAADVGLLEAFLRQHESPPPDATVDEAAAATRLSGRTDVLVKLIELEHH